MASAYYASCVLFAASDLGVFGALARHGKADLQTLAHDCGMDPRGAQLLLDAAVAVGLLTKEGALYANTPDAAAFLVPGSPADLSGAIRYNRDVYPAWGRLTALAKTGASVERAEVHLGENPDRTRTFVMSMHGRALGIGRMIVPMLDLAGCRRLFDVGGGPATYSTLIAKAWPTIQCTVLDLPPVAAIARELVEKQGMTDRVSVTGGDYHTAVFPPENDAVIFFGMLHQESPDAIRDLLRRAYASLNPGGKVFVLDMMTDDSRAQPPFSALFAVNMALTTPNGWVFSDAELKTWMSEAGFDAFECRPVPPPMPHWLATALKPR